MSESKVEPFRLSDSEEDGSTSSPVHVTQKATGGSYDDTIEVRDAEEVVSPPASANSRKGIITKYEAKMGDIKSEEEFDNSLEEKDPGPSNQLEPANMPGLTKILGEDGGSEQSENSEEEDEDDDDDDVQAAPLEGTYDPADYEHLPVSAEVKELFQYITRYTPQAIEVEYKLKPFVPDFIPAVGDIDAFLKVIRPDGQSDDIGLTVLDEPSAKQSDPAVLDLQLRAVAKQSSARSVVVKKVESAEKNVKSIDKWIKDISDLHRSKPPPTVHYGKPMPDIDSLMQEWPSEFEEQLKELGLPTADMDCELCSYVDIVCDLLDIPVYESRIQSLHVLFTLYSAIKNSQHFQTIMGESNKDNVLQENNNS